VVAAGEALSYAELAQRARAAAPGVPPLVPTTLPAGSEFAVVLHAAWAAGAAIVPLNPELAPPPPPRRVAAGTLAVVHTSGTTGEPRPVCLTRANFQASARGSAGLLGVEPGDRWLCCLPVFHVGGLSIFTRSAIYGTTVVAEPAFDAARVLNLLEAGEVTLASLVPTMLARLRDLGLERAPGLRALLLGGGPIPAGLLEWAAEAGLPVRATYGMTETTSQVATADVGERLLRPLPGARLRIARSEGGGPGGGPPDEGEILVRGPMVAADGWLHTHDRGRLTEDGLLDVGGRMDDVIVTGGENVAAGEVEQALLSHPGVREAAVIGVEDAEWGRAVTAFVVADAGPDELVAHCRGRLAAFKVPKRVLVLDELPRTASGKVERASLESRAHDLRQRR
jgi:O-succinylbenzoic acid--CoA ligase